jgi:hypothetical protein
MVAGDATMRSHGRGRAEVIVRSGSAAPETPESPQAPYRPWACTTFEWWMSESQSYANLHRRLATEAVEQHVSLNPLASDRLSQVP